MADQAARTTARFGLLFVGLLSIIVLSTPLAGTRYGPVAFTMSYLLSLAGAALAVGRVGRAGRIAIILWGATLAVELFIQLGGDFSLRFFGRLVDVFFVSWVLGILVSSLFKQERVDLDAVIGGICGYLLLGVVFYVVYALLETLHAGTFLDKGEPIRMVLGLHGDESRYPDLLYFSFVTLTTVGFGDVVAIGSLARSLTILEALAGQLYLAILVASLVSMHLAHRATTRHGSDR